MNKQYAIVIKTGDAELRAIENLPSATTSKLFPVIEITRGRKISDKSKKKLEGAGEVDVEIYPFRNRLEKLKTAFKNHTVCIDLTTESLLSSKTIDRMFNPNNGYENWINFLVNLKDEKCFKEIVPCVIMNWDDLNFEENLRLQIRNLSKNFNALLYRNSIADDFCYEDIDIIKSELGDSELVLMIDCGYILPASRHIFIEKTQYRLSELKKRLPYTKYIICGTSFPKQVSGFGNDYSDTFSLEEKIVFDELSKNNDNLVYGDYGTINPVRSDDIIMSRGWIPRIDVPLENEIYYYRLRRPKGISSYQGTYIEVARHSKSDPNFPIKLRGNWGVDEILRCAEGKPSSASPSFWISVRMNIHIQQQIDLL